MAAEGLDIRGSICFFNSLCDRHDAFFDFMWDVVGIQRRDAQDITGFF